MAVIRYEDAPPDKAHVEVFECPNHRHIVVAAGEVGFHLQLDLAESAELAGKLTGKEISEYDTSNLYIS
jgi:hypothetical protein